MNSKTLPLARLKVIDMTHARAGPACTRHLADWGAQVIRVEQPPSEGEASEVVGKRLSFDYQNLHRNKRAMTLNLKDKRGHAIFMELVKDADVIVENLRANVKHRLGVDYETISKINPRIIYGSISGFGQDGPYSDRPGLDQIVQGMSGLMSVTGLPHQGPVRTGIAISDLAAGALSALGIMMALFEREATGKGRWVTTSLMESLISLLDFQAARWLIKSELPVQEGNFHPTVSPTGTYPTLDGHINISAGGHRLWTRFCVAVEREDLAVDPRFTTYEIRAENRHALNELVSEITRTRSSADWIERFNAQGVPCGPIYSIDEMFDDAQVKHLGMTRPVDHPGLGEINLVAQGFNLEGVPKDIRMPTPGVGQHTDELLKELGHSDDQIATLRKEGVV